MTINEKEKSDIYEDTEYIPTLKEILSTIKRREIYLNLPVHLGVLIPATILMALLSKRIDKYINIKPIIPEPINIILFLIFISIGIFIVWYSYGYLLLKGEGSPASHLGGTTKLVTTDIFSVIRHPSVLGKLFGVIGLGCLFNSFTFLFIVIPILLIYSIITNRYLQEKYCEEKFGEAYRQYRKEVPMLIPKPKKLIQLIKDRIEFERNKEKYLKKKKPEDYYPGDKSPIAMKEFITYMVFLGIIILLFFILTFLFVK